VAKRRTLAPSDASGDEPKGRRAIRSEEDRRRLPGSKKPKDGPLWRRALVPGGVAATIIVVVLVIIWGTGHLFAPPCLSLSPIPATSGSPAFPQANTTDFSRTWCPDDTAVLISYPSVQIFVNGQSVALPDSIGRSSNFTDYTCDLPIETQLAAQGLGPNVVQIASPWPYEYTLGDLFAVWADSYSTARVNATYTTSTIDFTSTDLLGLPINAGHVATVFVDSQVSPLGPSLDLSTTTDLSGVYPACLASVYGTGHTIVIQYKAASSTTGLEGLHGPTLATAGAGGALVSQEFGSPMPRVTETASDSAAFEQAKGASFAWLAIRIAP
jgi:hypothetical protein